MNVLNGGRIPGNRKGTTGRDGSLKMEETMSLKDGSLIIVEGLIGVGKTTLGSILHDLLSEGDRKVRFFPEYVNGPLLNQYIGDMKKYAYGFQLVMMSRRLETYKDALSFCARTGGVAIVDRSILGDTAFARMQHECGNISSSEWTIYNEILRLEEDHLPPSQAVRYLFLQCPPEEALRRIHIRGFKEEVSGYTLGYLQDLERAYSASLHRAPNLLTLDWSSPTYADDHIATDTTSRRRIGLEVLHRLGLIPKDEVTESSEVQKES